MTGVRLSQGFADQYGDPAYADMMREEWLPWMLDGLDLGDDVLDLVAGSGPTVSSLLAPGRRVTVAQIAPAFTAAVADRFAAEPAVEVVTAEP